MKKTQEYQGELEFIDNEEKAYLIGLFYADGYVSSKFISCGVVVHSNDLDLLLKLQNIFPFFNIVKSHENAYRLQSGNKKLCKDINNNGVLYRKSYENKENLIIPDIEEHLISHFIRGFFDGDGSVFIQKINNIKVEIGCVGFNFITQLLKKMYDNNINFFMSMREPNTNNVRIQTYYRIYTSSYKESKKFADYIYRNDTVSLDRKKYLLNRELIERCSKERIQCPKCSSFSTVYMGQRGVYTRIKCKTCGKMSQIAHHSGNIMEVQDQPIHQE